MARIQACVTKKIFFLLFFWWKKNISVRISLALNKKWSFSFSEIPESIQDGVLEDCALKIFSECDNPVYLANMDTCHCLKSKARPKKVIIKLSKGEDVFCILQGKKKLKSVDNTNVGLPQGSLVFINQSLYSYYKYLWSLCKRLHSKKMIHSFSVSNVNVSLTFVKTPR